jgi:hypothetical protein
MSVTHRRHVNRSASRRDRPIPRSILKHGAQIDVDTCITDISIGRDIAPSSSAVPNKIANYVIGTETEPVNESLGSIVDPLDLRLEIVSPLVMNDFYDRYAKSKGYSNRNARNRIKNMRAMKADISDAFHAQEEDPDRVQYYEQPVSSGKRAKSIFESEVATIHYPPDKVMFERGEAGFTLQPQIVQDDLRVGLALHTRRDHPNFPVISDDLRRVNEALRETKVAGVKGLPALALSQLSLVVPVFVYDTDVIPEGVVTPLAPLGEVAFKSLSIHENQ